MNRNELVEKLVKEGFSATTLCKFNDKQLEKFAKKVLSEATLNIPKTDQAAIKTAQDSKQTFVTYEEENIEEKEEEIIPVSKIRRSGTKKTRAFNAEKINEFVDNVVENNYHSLTTKGEMVELIKNKVTVISEKQNIPAIPEFMEGVEVAEPAVKPETKPAKPDTDTPPKEKPRHPGQRPVDPNQQPLPDPAPKAKAINGDEAKSKIIQMVHKIFTNN
jgi:hypothetical protein